MKKIFTLLAATLVTLFSYADDHHNNGTMRISNFSDHEIRVVVDGRHYFNRDNSLVIHNLEPGYHTVKVFRDRQGNGHRRYKNGRAVFSSRILVKPRHEVRLVINRQGNAFVQESRHDEHRGYGRWDDRYIRPVDDRRFSMLTSALRRERFEQTRMQMFRDMEERNYFTSAQVAQMVRLFSFEKNRLVVAKQAYGKTVDRQQYAVVFSEFSRNTSRRELERYIRDFR